MKKTLENQLRVDLGSDLGLSPAESELLSYTLADWLQRQAEFRSPSQIIVQGASHRMAFSRGRTTSQQGKKIKVTPFQASDLGLELEFGLKTMQLGRILRLIEEAYGQDSLIDAKQLSLLCNITPTSLRSRLQDVKDLGIWAPVRGMSRKDRECGGLFRSTYLLQTYFSDGNMLEARRSVGYAKEEFTLLLSKFAAVALDQERQNATTDPEKQQWLALAKGVSGEVLEWLPSSTPSQCAGEATWDSLRTQLEEDYELSPVKTRVVRELLYEIMGEIQPDRADGDVVYWAVSSSEPAGKPLEECKLVPVKLSLLAEDDQPTSDNRDLNRLSEIKYGRALRYATEAKFAGGYLTYADLSYLMGIHPEAIRRLVNLNKNVVIPLRGAQCDIGRGVTHKRKIIELYLQMYTETEIVARTGHSYESIENYIREFGKVWLLHERGFPPAMIRKVTGRSMQLVQTYLDLVKEYDAPEYAFRFHHIKTFVEHAESSKKGGSDA
jgi:hypothetical protein